MFNEDLHIAFLDVTKAYDTVCFHIPPLVTKITNKSLIK